MALENRDRVTGRGDLRGCRQAGDACADDEGVNGFADGRSSGETSEGAAP
jgi:hypothetical protein